MSTVAEIVEAVSQLSTEQKTELLQQLEPLLAPTLEESKDRREEYFSEDFTRRLAAHFHQAKQAALRQA